MTATTTEGVRYTYEEAVEIVLKLKEQFGTMPTKEEYARVAESGEIDLNALLDALNKNPVEKNHAGYCAAINIAVLREIRRREGRKVYISVDDKNIWRPEQAVAAHYGNRSGKHGANNDEYRPDKL
ncbi:hypothetical protein IKF23_03325 [Candidatus Saccharibacteria bacterium]|nr:hypothetical protein [Candidatus Saccharibacteria bacterium]